MDATTRWETEAIRSSHAKRATPPRPSAKRTTSGSGDRTWLTLKEAEEATGIPANTLRKWVRKESIDTYLESDGEIALRMVALDSIRARAKELGRDIQVTEPDASDGPARPSATGSHAQARDNATTSHEVDTDSREMPSDSTAEATGIENSPTAGADTMLVPIDAWNKMLDQLGNLHEAGQQLAEARERAAKAETEATFLRERLRELRDDQSTGQRGVAQRSADTGDRLPESGPTEPGEGHAQPHSPSDDGYRKPDAGSRLDVGSAAPTAEEGPDTTTYWRYLTSGWRQRKRS